MATVFWTVVTGVTVYVIGQFIVKLVLDPIAEQGRAIGRVAHVFTFEADIYSNPGTADPAIQAASLRRLREASSELRAATTLIPFYDWLARAHLVLPRKNIEEACSNLTGISNSFSPRHVDEIYNRRKLIAQALKLPMN